MPWKEVSTMALRHEFVHLANQDGANVRELSRRFGISPTTAYKWLNRYDEQGSDGLRDQSRKPQNSPRQTDPAMERLVLELRKEHPAWGGRKLRARLIHQGIPDVPSASTITAILKRHDLIDPAQSPKHTRWQRFEREEPNELWQIDFKGHFPLQHGRCYPLTVLDDHSRYSLGVRACGNEREKTAWQQLEEIFRRHGLPQQITLDNGNPWRDLEGYSRFSVRLIRLGIRVSHSRPFHPQTQGKDERFHRTLKAELLQYRTLRSLQECQREFDRWRHVYNHERPHQGIGLAVPASRYRPSPRSYPQQLEPIEYGPDDIVRKVQSGGVVHLFNRTIKVGKAFRGYPVAIRPTLTDGVFTVYFCHQPIARLDVRNAK